MADTPEVRLAHYAKIQVRVLKVILAKLKASLRVNTNPKEASIIEANIAQLETVLFDRTGVRVL